MNNGGRFPYSAAVQAIYKGNPLPELRLALTYGTRTMEVIALLDTGSTVNVLPYTLGIELGASWEQQITPIQLAGNLAKAETRALMVSAQISHFERTDLVFAWTRADNVPLILGQMNFFLEFNVCFYRKVLEFELRPNG